MRMKIKLQTVIDAIEQASDAYTMLYDTKTNETVYLPDVWITGETDEDLAELIEKEPERFLRFPTKYEIHEYSIMDSFVDDLPAGRIKSELAGAIRGKGAFRRFKQTIRFQGVEQLWYDYQANGNRKITTFDRLLPSMLMPSQYAPVPSSTELVSSLNSLST